jgi:molybdate transport system ATP-binding protein
MSEPAIKARFRVDHGGFSLEVDLELAGRGVTAIFGPSGCGKTTLLRCVAGLTRASRGLLRVKGQLWQDDDARVWVPTHRRSLGVVFQEPSLFPHLSVQKNLEFGMKRSPAASPLEFDTVVAMLDLRPLLARRPAMLSGGERQRVAIGRALLVRPSLLLMDEPLASLDQRRKAEILPYIERLRDEVAVPILYVTHSLDEVARIADHLVLLDAGRVLGSGPLGSTLTRLDLPTAEADDASAVIEAVIGAHDEVYQLSRIDFAGGCLWIGRVARPLGAQVRARVQARDVSIALTPPVGSSIINVLPGVVTQIADTGPERVNLQMQMGEGGSVLLARITRRSRDALSLGKGMRVYAQIKGVALM